MKKVMFLLILSFAITICYSQGSQKLKGTSSAAIDSAAFMKQLQADWGKYLSDTIYKKETIKDFLDWFDANLSNKDYQTGFSQKVIPYYNLWLQAKYNEWFLKRPKK
jgi:hypothetical protein